MKSFCCWNRPNRNISLFIRCGPLVIADYELELVETSHQQRHAKLALKADQEFQLTSILRHGVDLTKSLLHRCIIQRIPLKGHCRNHANTPGGTGLTRWYNSFKKYCKLRD